MTHETVDANSKQTFLGKLLRPKVALPLTGLILLLLSPVLIRGWNLSQIPDVDEPTRTPIPVDDEAGSALAHYRAAVEKFVGPLYPVDPSSLVFNVLTDKTFLDDDEYSAHIKQETVDHFRRPLLPKFWENVGDSFMLKQEEIEAHFQQNTEAIAEFINAVNSKFTPTDDAWTFFESEESFALDSICSLVLLQADRDLQEQKLNACWKKLNCAYRHWQLTFCYEFRIYSQHYASFDEAILIELIDRLVSSPLMTQELFRQVMADLASARTLIPDVDRRIDRSYRVARQQILDLHTLVGASRELHEAGSIAEVGSAVARQSGAQLYMRGEPELSLRVLKHHYQWLRHWIDHGGNFPGPVVDFPYLTHPVPVAPSKEIMAAEEVRKAFETQALYLREIEFHPPGWKVSYDLDVSRHDLITLHVARKWFERDHSRRITSNDELVPAYLDSVPEDPFHLDPKSTDWAIFEWEIGTGKSDDVKAPLFETWESRMWLLSERYWPRPAHICY